MLFFRKSVPQAAPLIVVAPDKFKGTLSAAEAASIIARAAADVVPHACVRVCPVADGGEGTAAILAPALSLEKVSQYIPDALGVPQPSEYFSDGVTVALDSSAVIGLQRIAPERRDPLHSSSYPLGELVGGLLASGVKRILLGIGGTATVDGGVGFLQALGARFYDFSGRELPAPLLPVRMGEIFSADFSLMRHRELRNAVVALADVDVPLEGSLDYAVQKGVTPDSLPWLGKVLSGYRRVAEEALNGPADTPSAGAGGGLGFALGRVIGCEVRSGAAEVLSTYDFFGEELPALIVTGEGCIDSQTCAGKAVWGIYTRARKHSVPVLALVGQSLLGEAPEGMEICPTAPLLHGRELNRASAARTLDAAARQALAAVAVRLWG